MAAFKTQVPAWVLVISSLFALLPFIVGISLIVSPAAVLKDVNLQANGTLYLVQVWAVRQLAFGVIFVFSIIRRSVSMMTIAYLFLLVMNAGDELIGICQKNTSIIIGSLVWMVIAVGMLYILNRKNVKG